MMSIRVTSNAAQIFGRLASVASEAQIAASVKAYNATPDMPHRHRHAVKNAIEAALHEQGTPVSGDFEPIRRICPSCTSIRLNEPSSWPKPPYIVALCLKHGGTR